MVLYFLFAYTTQRTEFNQLLFLWIGLFACYVGLLKNKQSSFAYLAGIAVLFRLIFFFALPNLSQDFYRFIWDGRMILEGLNPYLSLPETFIEQHDYPIPQAKDLYAGMGTLNGSHYTNYPPMNQLCFFIAAVFAKNSIIGSVVVMRTIIILADIGILYFGKKLLKRLQLPVKNIFIYILNPFVIIELTGNLHFESVMLFFLVFALYKLHQQQWFLAGVLLACSVSVKLIPLLFLPLFFQWFVKNDASVFKGFQKLAFFYITIIATVVLLFLPFYAPELIVNYTNSVGLWFRNFEFNASFYYVAREIGYLFRGYNEIAIIGKIIPILTSCFLLILTFFRKNKSLKQLLVSMLFALSFYYFLTTTMHPWYIATLLILSVFTRYRYAVLWSFVVILSYQAYANAPWKEHLWLVALEYIVVYSYFTWEVFIKNKTHSKN
nr:mannosyltransferase [Tenacibaculum tangerinum]